MSDCLFKSYEFLQNSKSDVTIKCFLKEDGTHKYSILGYPDDEGIKLNGGKAGASLGPDSIRKSLYKMTPTKGMSTLEIADLGNLNFKTSSIEDKHSFASKKVLSELQKNKTCIGLGGGHDYGYVDGAAFLKNHKLQNNKTKPLIFNFDAHFDLRDLDKGLSSGTPFFRLLEEFGESFELFEIGIQNQCNSQNLFDLADSKPNVHTLSYTSLFPDHVFDFGYAKKEIESRTKGKQDCYISVDIDGFSSAFAPGCSQSWPTGFDISSFFQIFEYLNSRFNVRVLGVYEVSPPLDHTELTSRLAALIVYRFLELGAQNA